MGLLATLPTWATITITNTLLFFLIGGMAGSCDAKLLEKKFTTIQGFRGIVSGLVCQVRHRISGARAPWISLPGSARANIVQFLLDSMLKKDNENTFDLCAFVHRFKTSPLELFGKMERCISQKSTAVIVT